jgi:hypothetical protein
MKINEFFDAGRTDYEIVNLTDEDIQMAQEYEKKISELALMKKANYTSLSTTKRYFIGYLGELAFHKYLEKYNIDHEWNQNTSGKSDNGDFIIKNLTFDVKTSSHPNATCFIMPEAQLRHFRDYYVAIKLIEPEKKVVIYGVLTSQEVKEMPVKNFGYGVQTKYQEYLTI